MTIPQMPFAGTRLAELGAEIYNLADTNPALEATDEFNQMMQLMNALSYQLIHGKPQPSRTPVPADHAFQVLKEAMQADPDLAWTWHCNIAVAFQDEGASHQQANQAAARFMSTAFNINVTTFPQWKAFPWASLSPDYLFDPEHDDNTIDR